MQDHSKRFSSKAQDYECFRPSYPEALLDYFAKDFGMNGNSLVADIGSGTGIFTALLLDRVQTVYAVEPNDEMRAAAEKRLTHHPHFVSVQGRAEATGLHAESIDFITAAQAFHWFDLDKTRAEFVRILKKSGRVFLVWNTRSQTTDFMRAYEDFLQKEIPEFREKSYPQVHEEDIRRLLNAELQKKSFPNTQVLDWQGLLGRFNSSSYVPSRDLPESMALEEKLKRIFDQNEKDGKISFLYETIVYSGKVQG